MPVGSTNPGPAIESTVNTATPRGFFQFIETIAVSITPTAIATATTTEQSFGSAGVTQATASTGILPGDVILSVNPPSLSAGVGLVGYRVDIATADKFYLQWVTTTTTLTPPVGIYLITVGRYIQSVSTTPQTFSSLPTSIVTTS